MILSDLAYLCAVMTTPKKARAIYKRFSHSFVGKLALCRLFCFGFVFAQISIKNSTNLCVFAAVLLDAALLSPAESSLSLFRIFVASAVRCIFLLAIKPNTKIPRPAYVIHLKSTTAH